jgi:hypothetical protein
MIAEARKLISIRTTNETNSRYPVDACPLDFALHLLPNAVSNVPNGIQSANETCLVVSPPYPLPSVKVVIAAPASIGTAARLAAPFDHRVMQS